MSASASKPIEIVEQASGFVDGGSQALAGGDSPVDLGLLDLRAANIGRAIANGDLAGQAALGLAIGEFLTASLGGRDEREKGGSR